MKKTRLAPFFFIAACLLFFYQPLGAVDRLPDFTGLVEQSAPAVVNISTVRGQVQRQTPMPPSGDFPDLFQHFFGQSPFGGQPFAQPGPQRQRPSRQSLGSGFIISQDGYIVTNHHVIEGAQEILVRLSDRREYQAELIGSDPATDLALLKIEAEDLPVVRLGDSENLRVGSWVLAIGSPFGFDHSVTAGIVSAIGRSLPNETYVPFIQTDVAINPGNSGGPLFNLQGEVVGVNSQIYTRSGGFMGLSFAIPVQVVEQVVAQLRDDGRVVRGWLGVVIQNIDVNLAQSFGLDRPRGALIAQVDSRSPAAAGGLQAGDIVLEVEGRSIEVSSDLPPAVGRIRPGDEGRFRVLRDGSEIELHIQVGERPDDSQGQRSAGRADPKSGLVLIEDRLGLTLTPLSDAQRQRWNLEAGLEVTQIDSSGLAAQAGVRRGDVLVSLAGQSITSLEVYQQLVEQLPAGRAVPLRLVRQGSPLFVAIYISE